MRPDEGGVPESAPWACPAQWTPAAPPGAAGATAAAITTSRARALVADGRCVADRTLEADLGLLDTRDALTRNPARWLTGTSAAAAVVPVNG